ncbi:MAG: DUF4276 family protein [Planctomycetaceae bacterium]
MRHLKVMPIVEGDGEVPAVPILLRRICAELMTDVVPYILTPIRQPKDRLLANKDACLEKAVNLAVKKLRQFRVPDAHDLVLVLVDADDQCAAQTGPLTFEIAHKARSDADIAVVLAVPEYETWFVAAAPSLYEFVSIDDPANTPTQPDADRIGKAWIKKHFIGPKYSETVDQPKLTAKMDLTLCRTRSPSFDKLCREMEARNNA